MDSQMNGRIDFFITSMSDTRPADYHLSYFGDSVFIDFDNCNDGRICLKRISFDGYGCCDLNEEATPMDEVDSREFKHIIETDLRNQLLLLSIIKRTIQINKELIWEDALEKYALL